VGKQWIEAHEHKVQNPVCFETKLHPKIIFIFILLVPLYDSKVTYCIIYGGEMHLFGTWHLESMYLDLTILQTRMILA